MIPIKPSLQSEHAQLVPTENQSVPAIAPRQAVSKRSAVNPLRKKIIENIEHLSLSAMHEALPVFSGGNRFSGISSASDASVSPASSTEESVPISVVSSNSPQTRVNPFRRQTPTQPTVAFDSLSIADPTIPASNHVPSGHAKTGPRRELSLESHAQGLLPDEITKLMKDGFRDFKTIGIGNYGEVYKAAMPDGTPICVKVNFKETISNEYDVMQALDSPRLCKAIMHSKEHSPKMLMMEYATGLPLDNEDARALFCKTPAVQQLNWIKNALMALNEIHQAGYSHNDISAGNILLNTNAANEIDLKVIDFGRASTLTKNSHLGSPIFISPELINTTPKNRSPELRMQSDFYALGICVVTFFGKWQNIKVNNQKLSTLSPVKLQQAHRMAMNEAQQKWQAPNIDEIDVPNHLKPVVDKLINLQSSDNVESIATIIDQCLSDTSTVEKVTAGSKQES